MGNLSLDNFLFNAKKSISFQLQLLYYSAMYTYSILLNRKSAAKAKWSLG